MPRTLYFIRHGETEWNKERRMQGQLDAPLTELGEQQARLNAEAVAGLGVDAIIASPLGRVRASLAPLEELSLLRPRFDDLLMEWHAGLWSSQLHEEISSLWPEAWERWQADPWTYGPEGGESLADLWARGAEALRLILAMEEERVAVLSHGFIGRMMLGQLVGLDWRRARDISTPNDRVHVLQNEGHVWSVRRIDAGGALENGLLFKSGEVFTP